MTSLCLRASILVISCALGLGAQGSSPAQQAFEQIKSLKGDWQTIAPDGKVQRTTYRVIANGSAVEEALTGDEGEMLTVYTLDGDRVLLTHFCVAHNQPRLQAASMNDGTLDFHFLDASGLASPDAGHMHDASFHFTDENHFSETWSFVENGKTKFKETIQFARLR